MRTQPKGMMMSEEFVDLLQREAGQDSRVLAAYRLLDWLGCAVVGAREASGKAVANYARSLPSGPVACIGGGKREASVAAFVNGALGNVLEMDDLHRMAIVHPADTVIPAVLAVAQRESSCAEALLTSIVRGYEAAIRVGEAAGPRHYHYWYSTSTCGVFGAAVASASLLGCDKSPLGNAIGLAGMQASGLWQCRLDGGFAKQIATARAAQGGVMAADLARLGVTAPRDIIEGELGFLAATASLDGLEGLLHDPAGPWKIHEISEKPWPGCRHTHPVVEAALRYREAVQEEQIVRVEIYTYKSAVDFCNDAEPDTPHRARFSLQHAFAVALLKGEPELKDYELMALTEDAVRRVRHKVEVFESPEISDQFPQRFGCRMVLHTLGGERIEQNILSAKGDPENPVDADSSRKKFRRLMAHAGIDEKMVSDFEEVILGLPHGASTTRLFDLLDILACR